MQRKDGDVYTIEEGRKLIAIKGKSGHPESKLQQACVTWFRLAYPRFRKLLFAVPNGGARSKVEAMIMNGEGVVAGVTDLILAVPCGTFHGMFIEMKYGKNTLSDNQKDFLAGVKAQGYHTAVCYTIDEFMKEVNQYLS